MQSFQELVSFPMEASPLLPSIKRPRSKSSVIKGQWSENEDKLLESLVREYGEKKWSQIANNFVGRVGKQCRERWNNHLRPDIKKASWTEEEERVLVSAHAELGNKWAEIARRIPGRTENSIKNHWNATKRRQLTKRKCRRVGRNGVIERQSTVLQNYMRNKGIVPDKEEDDMNQNYTSMAAMNPSCIFENDFNGGSGGSSSNLYRPIDGLGFDNKEVAFLHEWANASSTATSPPNFEGHTQNPTLNLENGPNNLQAFNLVDFSKIWSCYYMY